MDIAQPDENARDDGLAALVARAQRDPAEFVTLYDRYVQSVYRYHFSRVGNAPDAQDLTAQTFLAALEALPRYRHRGYFAAWLFRIARSQRGTFFRSRSRETDSEPAEAAPAPGDALAALVERAPLRALLRALDDDERELLNLRYAADLKFGEIADLLGRNEAAVKKALYRLLARLQAQLEAHDE